MAKRVYELPIKERLTKKQRKILRLKPDGQHLIVGAPGTGKSVVALYRAIDLNRTNHKKTTFLTFNHVLLEANKQLVKEELESNTAMSWFYSLYWEITGGKPDNFDEDKMPERDRQKPDYEKVLGEFSELSRSFEDYFLIIDEGQDLPPDWYECVQELDYLNFFVVADQNQQITDENSSRKDLEASLGLESSQVIKLEDNFRNSTPIAMFSNCFYTDKSSPMPAIPKKPSADYPILFSFSNIKQIYIRILEEYDRDPSKLIGLFVPNETKRMWYSDKLKQDHLPSKPHNDLPVVSTYSSKQKSEVNIDFSNGGIVVLNDKSVKGIELDIVFIIIDDFKEHGDSDQLKKRLYVMASRAREKLFLFQGERPSVFDDFLPQPAEVYEFEGVDGNSISISGDQLLKREVLPTVKEA